MAITLHECEEMVRVAIETGQYLMLGHNQRLAKAHVKAKELIDAGQIGEIIGFRTTFGHSGPETWSIDPGKNVWFFDKNKAAMGVMADLGIHKTDLIHFLTSQTIVETTARLTTLDKKDASGAFIGVDDNAICIFRLSGGAVGTMTASWTFYGDEDNSTILYGTKGIMRIYDDLNYSIKVTTCDNEKIYYDLDRIQTNDSQTKSGIIDAFITSIITKKEPAISGAEILKTMRVIFASIESSQKGQAILINQA